MYLFRTHVTTINRKELERLSRYSTVRIVSLKVVTNEKGEAVEKVLTIIC